MTELPEGSLFPRNFQKTELFSWQMTIRTNNMAIGSALGITVSALQTFQAALSVSFNNIANASNDGFSRRDTRYATLFSGGVRLSEIERITADTLRRSFLTANSAHGLSQTAHDLYDQIEDLTGANHDDNPPLSNFLTALEGNLKRLENDPSNPAAQAAVVRAGVDIGNELRRLVNGLLSIENQANLRVENDITSLNQSLVQLHVANETIRASGLNPNDAFDDRDRALANISGFVEVNALYDGDGSVRLYTKRGMDLLDVAPAQFAWDRTQREIVRTDLGPVRPVVTRNFGPGSLRAHYNFLRDDEAALVNPSPELAAIEKLKGALDDIAYELARDTGYSVSGLSDSNGDGIDDGVFSTNNPRLTLDSNLGAVRFDYDLGAGPKGINFSGGTVQDFIDDVRMDDPRFRVTLNSFGRIDIGVAGTGVGEQDAFFISAPTLLPADTTLADELHIDLAALEAAGRYGHYAVSTVPHLDGAQSLTSLSATAGETITWTVGANTSTFTVGAGSTVTNLVNAINQTAGTSARLRADGRIEVISANPNDSIGFAGTGMTVLASLGLAGVASQKGILPTVPPPFNKVYRDSRIATDGTEAQYFFASNRGDEITGNPRTDLVNAFNLVVATSLVSGTRSFKADGISDSLEVLVASGRSVTFATEQIRDTSYRTMVERFIGNRTTTASSLQIQNRITEARTDVINNAIKNTTGVNLQEEEALQIALQRAYSASAKMLRVIQILFDSLNAAV